MAANPLRQMGMIEGGLYKVADFFTRYLNVPPNKHRLLNALGGLAGIYGTRQLMNVLAGETPQGEKIDVNDVLLPLRPLHGLLAYDHFSDLPKDRWWKLLDQIAPAIGGGIGAGMGSDLFSQKFLNAVAGKMGKIREELKAGTLVTPFTINDAEREALHHQGRALGTASSHAAGYGSASGYGILPNAFNYSTMLGAKFSFDAERATVVPFFGKRLRNWLFNSHSIEPFRPTKLIDSTVQHLLHNPSPLPQNAIETMEGVVKTWFKDVTPQQVEAFKELVLKEFATLKADTIKAVTTTHPGKPQEALTGEITKSLTDKVSKLISSSNDSIEKLFIAAGIDPRTACIGQAGMFTDLSRWIGDMTFQGTTKKLRATQDLMIQSMEQRHPDLKQLFPDFVKPDLGKSHSKAALAAGAGTMLTSAGILGAISTAKDTSIYDLNQPPGKAENNSGAQYQTVDYSQHGDNLKKQADTTANTNDAAHYKRRHKIHSKKDRGILNGQMLDTLEGITGGFNASIGMHRAMCAGGLFVGSLLGDEVMKALTGMDFFGKAVKKEDIWKPLQKIYKALPFNPHSDGAHDKWIQAIRWGVPGIIGTMAVLKASNLFFEDRNKTLKNAKYLDEIEEKATMAQSEPWSYASAISGLMGFGTGAPFLPLANYSTNLGTRFSLGSGRKVSMPILGKIWSNNSTLFPFGPSGMLDLAIREAVQNKAFDPELLETYAIGALKPWYDNIKPEQVEAFVNHIYDIRDRYYQEGGVPEHMKKQLESELKAHIKGAGLEKTLREIGLDPRLATIANNGISGEIANMLGARGNVEKIKKDYTANYVERLENQPSPASGQAAYV